MGRIDYRDYLEILDGGAIGNAAVGLECLHELLEKAETDEERKRLKRKIKFHKRQFWFLVMLKKYFGIEFEDI